MFHCIYSLIQLLEDMGTVLNCTVVSLKTWSLTDIPKVLRHVFVWWHYTLLLKEWRSQPILTQVVGMGRSNRLGGANFLQLSLFFPIPHPPCCMHLPSQPATPHIAQPTNQTETCLEFHFFGWICPPMLCLPPLSPWVLLAMVLCTSKNGGNSPA